LPSFAGDCRPCPLLISVSVGWPWRFVHRRFPGHRPDAAECNWPRHYSLLVRDTDEVSVTPSFARRKQKSITVASRVFFRGSRACLPSRSGCAPPPRPSSSRPSGAMLCMTTRRRIVYETRGPARITFLTLNSHMHGEMAFARRLLPIRFNERRHWSCSETLFVVVQMRPADAPGPTAVLGIG
jgi:hypothetical protein